MISQVIVSIQIVPTAEAASNMESISLIEGQDSNEEEDSLDSDKVK